MNFETLLATKEKRLQDCQELIEELKKEEEILNHENIKITNRRLQELINKEILFFNNLEYTKFKNNPHEINDLEDEIYFYFNFYIKNIDRIKLEKLDKHKSELTKSHRIRKYMQDFTNTLKSIFKKSEELIFKSESKFIKYKESYRTRKDTQDFTNISKLVLENSKDLFSLINIVGFFIVIFILAQHFIQTKTIPFIDSQKIIALAVTGILFGGIFCFFYIAVFVFSRELHKYFLKIPIKIPILICIATLIIFFITQNDPSIKFLFLFLITLVVANIILWFFGRKYIISSNMIEICAMQTILIFILYAVIAFIYALVIINTQITSNAYLFLICIGFCILFNFLFYINDFKFFILTNAIILIFSLFALNKNIISYLKIGNFNAELLLSKNKTLKDKLIDNNISFIENTEGIKVENVHILSDAKDAYYIQSEKEDNTSTEKSFIIDKKYVLDKNF
ncbi:MFS transporter [Campylobacter lari]|nr:MFS transporter [Campylobacter lari]EGK8030004.1 MFS transporter [Campylobacter lari]